MIDMPAQGSGSIVCKTGSETCPFEIVVDTSSVPVRPDLVLRRLVCTPITFRLLHLAIPALTDAIFPCQIVGSVPIEPRTVTPSPLLTFTQPVNSALSV